MYSPLQSEVERRNNYIAVSLRAANRQKPTVLKLAALFHLSAAEQGISIDQVMDHYNNQDSVLGTRLELSKTTTHASALATIKLGSTSLHADVLNLEIIESCILHGVTLKS